MNIEFEEALKRAVDHKKDKDDGPTKVLSLTEIMLRWFTTHPSLDLSNLPLTLRTSVNIRRCAEKFCTLFDPKSPSEHDIYTPLDHLGDAIKERRYQTRLYIFCLELFEAKNAFYDDDIIHDLREIRKRRNIYTHLYYKYHLIELPNKKDYVMPQKRDSDFDISRVDIGELFSLDPILMKIVSKFEDELF